MSTNIYIATVGLDRNRWGSREPSFNASEWLPRFKADGFDGVELWEFHYLRSGKKEQHRLEAEAAPLSVYNSYVGFDDDDAEARQASARGIERLRAKAIKYNLGHKADLLDEYRRNLLAWADVMPPDCQLLCECHQGTVLESVESASAFFADLDPARFGVIIHWNGDASGCRAWLDAFGERVRHMHVQLRDAELDTTDSAVSSRLRASFEEVVSFGFSGSVSLEFSRGIGKGEEIEALYSNMLADLNVLRQV